MASDGAQNPSGGGGAAKGTVRRSTPARQRDPRWLAVALEALHRLGPTTSDVLADALRARAALEPDAGIKPMRGVDRRAGWRQVGHLQRELQILGWIDVEGQCWSLTPKGREIAGESPASNPFSFARQLCLVGEHAYQGVVSRLLARLWDLNPERQGSVILPVPSLDRPPAHADLLDHWLRTVLRAQAELLKSLLPGFELPDQANELPVVSKSASRFAKWDELPPYRKRARVLNLVEERTLDWLFGGIGSSDEIKVWQTRMDWAGLSLLARHLPRIRGKVWFPVGAFREQGAPAFTPVPGIERGGRTYHCHTPLGPEAESSFADCLFQGYESVQREERTEYVSLGAVRDATCYHLRISHESFQGLLQAIFPRIVRRELPYALALEVDITPEERTRLGASLPIVIDHIPRYIIAMRRAPRPG